ncbi:hypothetical protein SK128_020069, partial [Halocaridina rubra]
SQRIKTVADCKLCWSIRCAVSNGIIPRVRQERSRGQGVMRKTCSTSCESLYGLQYGLIGSPD